MMSFKMTLPTRFTGGSKSSTTGDSLVTKGKRSLPNFAAFTDWDDSCEAVTARSETEKDINETVTAVAALIAGSELRYQGQFLATTMLTTAQLCLNKLFCGCGSFFDELTAHFLTDKAEAWNFLSNIVKRVFLDIAMVRAPGRCLKSGHNKTLQTAATIVWSSLQALRAQQEYVVARFREHPSVAQTITLHLYGHRAPRSTFDLKMLQVDKSLKANTDLANKAMTKKNKKP
jgi:hypothetical protein